MPLGSLTTTETVNPALAVPEICTELSSVMFRKLSATAFAKPSLAAVEVIDEMEMEGESTVSVWVAVTWPVLSAARRPLTPMNPPLGLAPETGVAVEVSTDQAPVVTFGVALKVTASERFPSLDGLIRRVTNPPALAEVPVMVGKGLLVVSELEMVTVMALEMVNSPLVVSVTETPRVTVTTTS